MEKSPYHDACFHLDFLLNQTRTTCIFRSYIHGISHVVYVRSFNSRNEPHVSFLFASSKIAPRCPNSIPHLELCAVVDMSIATLSFSRNLQIETENVFLYCDSKIVFSYISNTTKRFSRYVTRRVNLITKSLSVCFSLALCRHCSQSS